jgi:hypothetical protein
VHGTVYEFEALPDLLQPAPLPRERRPAPAFRGEPLVGIIRNPRSHRNRGVAAEMADCPNILTETPATRADIARSLAEFARRGIDYLVVDGGDGTMRDVLTCGADIYGDQWPELIVLPKGKTNALTVDLGLPQDWSLGDALGAAKRGRTLARRPLRVRDAARESKVVQGFILGAGAFTLGIEAGQEAHRRGAFNSMAVAVTVLWGVIQALFGRAGNPWRACTPMSLVDRESGQPLPHSGRGDPGERYLAIATTFERFPFGARPFGRDAAPGLKIALIDWPVRWVMAALPAILMGWYSQGLARNGATRTSAREVEIDLGGSFILDGEAFPAGRYILSQGPQLTFVIP